VIAIRDFDQSTAAQTEDTYGGVVAANSAVRTTLNALAIFCQDELLDWQQHPAIH